ncbi:formate-dependent uric acid utilization protein AegA [Celerinatantimonas yamalensis]|uniref:Formate-dependent uric acid utilization protein AegA n=1 Tax=Celerinatantimonas yamalensis TaxID=559956 RepID=A0ABW9G529_9GAMM
MNHFIFTNTQQCIGCHACEIACVMAHNDDQHVVSEALFHPRIRVVKIGEHHNVVTCHHCEQAPCVDSCPMGAITSQGGSVHVEQSLCIGCKSCEVSCPFGAFEVVLQSVDDGINAQAIKCDLCEGRDAGPACVEQCPSGALQLVDATQLAVMNNTRRQLAAIKSAQPWHRDQYDNALDESIEPESAKSKLAQIATTAPRQDPIKIPLAIRRTQFTELYQTFSTEQAQQQSERCLKCGDHSICEWQCPLHNHIPQWIELIKAGRVMEAVELSHQTNCMPEITGRICPQDRLCENQCTLKDSTGAVTIGNIERYIAEQAFASGWQPDLSSVVPTGYKVAIVGAGPAGLACADQLVRHGVKVCVFDRHPEIGGLLTFGIPAFKLDKSLLARRRDIFAQMGIEFQLNCEVGQDIAVSQLLEEYDAMFVGVGTYQPMQVKLPHNDAPGVFDALPYLIANTRFLMRLDELPEQPYIDLVHQQVVVLGGGDTAMDCVRTALRQDAKHVTCAYRRDEANMPGSKKEVQNAKEEGVEFEFNVQPISIELNQDGSVSGIQMLRTQLGEPGDDGRRRPEPIAGSEFVMPADAVIIAFGFLPHDLTWLAERHIDINTQGRIVASVQSHYPYQTSNPKIFAGGDAVRGADLVVTAMAEGRHAAAGLLSYLTQSHHTE